MMDLDRQRYIAVVGRKVIPVRDFSELADRGTSAFLARTPFQARVRTVSASDRGLDRDEAAALRAAIQDNLTACKEANRCAE